MASVSKVTRRSTELNLDQIDAVPGRPPSEQFELEPDLEAGMGNSLPRKFFKRHDTNPARDIRSPSFSPELKDVEENELSTPQIVNSTILDTPPRPQKLKFAAQ